jgi:hypothetical protein
MKPGQDLYDITSNVLLGMKDVLSDIESKFNNSKLFLLQDTEEKIMDGGVN